MMRRTFILACAAVISTPLYAQDAHEIVRKANDLMRGTSTFSRLTMTIVKPEWSRSVSMKVWAIEPDYSLVYVTEPARDRGTVTLKRKTEVWNWLPSVQRMIKIPPSMMLQPWMGSDFTNDDLVRQSSIVEDYTHSIAGEDTMEGLQCWKIALVPKPEAGVVWGKLIMWISRKRYISLRTEYYDEDGVLVKVFTGSRLRTFDGRTFASHWEMIPVSDPGKKTILDYDDVNFRTKLGEGFFSEQNMKNLR